MRSPLSSRRGTTGVELLLALATGFGVGAYGFTEVSGLTVELQIVESLDTDAAASTGAGIALDSDGGLLLYQPEQTCTKMGCRTTWTSFKVEIEGVTQGAFQTETGDDSIVLYQDGDDVILRAGRFSSDSAEGPTTYIQCFDADAADTPSCELDDADDGLSLRVGVSKRARNGADALLPFDYTSRMNVTRRPLTGPSTGDAVCVAVEDGVVVSMLGLGFTNPDALLTGSSTVSATEWVRPCPSH